MARNLWKTWELRTMVLLSLTLQFFLFKFGNRRRYTNNQRLLLFFVWSTYMLADWIATVSLSSLLDKKGDFKDCGGERNVDQIVAVWAPFLLLHLGGPDTITAYSLQDNELWLRHLVGLVIQAGIAFYVSFTFWTCRSRNALEYAAIPILFAGIIKYGERIGSLRSASQRQIRNSLLEASPKKHGSSKHTNAKPNRNNSKEVTDLDMQLDDDAKYLHEAYLLYKLFRNLFADLTLRFYREAQPQSLITKQSRKTEEAFRLVEVELELLYDVLHTKANIFRSRAGMSLRFFCFSCYISAFVAFSVFVDSHRNGYSISTIDVGITYLLLVGAIVLDVMGLVNHIFSSWTMLWLTLMPRKLAKIYIFSNRTTLWLTKTLRKLAKTVYKVISSRKKERQGSMAQCNLIDYCLEAKTSKWVSIQRFFDPYDLLVKRRYVTVMDVDDALKKLIFCHIEEKHIRFGALQFNFDVIEEILDERFDVIEQFLPIHDSFDKEFFLKTVNYDKDDDPNRENIEFEECLLIWHIATDLNYYEDEVNPSGEDIWEGVVTSLKRKVSKSLSNYMFYLLSIRPFMLPKGISEARIRNTRDHVQKCFPRGHKISTPDDRQKLRHELLDQTDKELTMQQHGSSLFDGIKLAHQLQLLGANKWEVISKMWVEMLTYAASKCEWSQHAAQLMRGKELLTQVSLLMAHLLLSKQIGLVKSPDLGTRDDGRHLYDWNHLYYLA